MKWGVVGCGEVGWGEVGWDWVGWSRWDGLDRVVWSIGKG